MDKSSNPYNGLEGNSGDYSQHHFPGRPSTLPIISSVNRYEQMFAGQNQAYSREKFHNGMGNTSDVARNFIIGDPMLVGEPFLEKAYHQLNPRFHSPEFEGELLKEEQRSYLARYFPHGIDSAFNQRMVCKEFSPTNMNISPLFSNFQPSFENQESISLFHPDNRQMIDITPACKASYTSNPPFKNLKSSPLFMPQTKLMRGDSGAQVPTSRIVPPDKPRTQPSPMNYRPERESVIHMRSPNEKKKNTVIQRSSDQFDNDKFVIDKPTVFFENGNKQDKVSMSNRKSGSMRMQKSLEEISDSFATKNYNFNTSHESIFQSNIQTNGQSNVQNTYQAPTNLPRKHEKKSALLYKDDNNDSDYCLANVLQCVSRSSHPKGRKGHVEAEEKSHNHEFEKDRANITHDEKRPNDSARVVEEHKMIANPSNTIREEKQSQKIIYPKGPPYPSRHAPERLIENGIHANENKRKIISCHKMKEAKNCKSRPDTSSEKPVAMDVMDIDCFGEEGAKVNENATNNENRQRRLSCDSELQEIVNESSEYDGGINDSSPKEDNVERHSFNGLLSNDEKINEVPVECDRKQDEFSVAGPTSLLITEKPARKMSDLTREERAIQYAMLKFQEMEEQQNCKANKRRHSSSRKRKEFLEDSNEPTNQTLKPINMKDGYSAKRSLVKAKKKKISDRCAIALELEDAADADDKHNLDGCKQNPNMKTTPNHVFKDGSIHDDKESTVKNDTRKLSQSRGSHEQRKNNQTKGSNQDRTMKQCSKTDLHQKSYLLVPSYRGFKDFLPIVLEGRTRRKSTQADSERIGKQKFPILVIEQVGEKKNEILVKENENLEAKIAKESLLAENVFDYADKDNKSKCNVRQLSCNRTTGETVLHKAARLGYDDVVDIKIKEGADVNARDNAGWTALHEAASRGNIDVVRVLLRYGADPNSCSENGIRPVHDAVDSNNIDVIRLLLRYGADASTETYSGSKILQLARSASTRKFLKGYAGDIQESSVLEDSEEFENDLWDFHGSSYILDSEGDDADEIFSGFPNDAEHVIEFEASNEPSLPSYNLPVYGDDSLITGYKNYYMLQDVLNRLQCSRQTLLKRHKIELRYIEWTEFTEHIRCSQVSMLPEEPSFLDGDDVFVELVHLGPFTARKVFDLKTYQI